MSPPSLNFVKLRKSLPRALIFDNVLWGNGVRLGCGGRLFERPIGLKMMRNKKRGGLNLRHE